MPPQREFPPSVLETAIEATLPQTRRDMDASEIYAYIVANPEALRSKLQQFGANPDHYNDVPVIVDHERLDADTRLDPASVAAITAVAKARARSSPLSTYLRSTGPLWSGPGDDGTEW